MRACGAHRPGIRDRCHPRRGKRMAENIIGTAGGAKFLRFKPNSPGRCGLQSRIAAGGDGGPL